MAHGYPDYTSGKAGEGFKLGELEIRYLIGDAGINAGGSSDSSLDLTTTGKYWRILRIYITEETIDRPLEVEFTDGVPGFPVMFFSGSFSVDLPGLLTSLSPFITLTLTNNHTTEKAWITYFVVLVEYIPD